MQQGNRSSVGEGGGGGRVDANTYRALGLGVRQIDRKYSSSLADYKLGTRYFSQIESCYLQIKLSDNQTFENLK